MEACRREVLKFQAEWAMSELCPQAAKWKANHDAMVMRCALLRQRPDLPVDRIPAADAFRRKISELESMVMDAYIAGFEAGEEGVIELVSSRLPDFPSELRGDAIACFERDFPGHPSITSCGTDHENHHCRHTNCRRK